MIYRKVSCAGRSTPPSYLSDVRADRWVPIQFDILCSSFLLLQQVCRDQGPNCWANNWIVPGRRLRSLCTLSQPLSRTKFFSTIWPSNIIKLINNMPSLDVNLKTDRKKLLCNPLFWTIFFSIFEETWRQPSNIV